MILWWDEGDRSRFCDETVATHNQRTITFYKNETTSQIIIEDSNRSHQSPNAALITALWVSQSNELKRMR